jgi:hypothetical protein
MKKPTKTQLFLLFVLIAMILYTVWRREEKPNTDTWISEHSEITGIDTSK